MPTKPPIIVAHRGKHDVYPENSPAAFHDAWGVVEWAECDVHESAGGHLFVLHDPTLDEKTDGTGGVAERTDAELAACRLRDRRGAVTSHRLARLSDVVAAMPAAGRLMVEVKAATDFAGLIRDLAGRPAWVQSFVPDHLRLTAEQDPRLPLAILVESERQLAAALAGPYRAVHIDHTMLARAHARLTAAGKAVGVWTVNDDADLRDVMGRGVEVVITDRPGRAAEIADELFGPAFADARFADSRRF